MRSLVRICKTRRVALAAPADEETIAQVRGLLAGMFPPGTSLERRREQRFPFPRLLQLTPVSADGLQRLGPSVTAAGKQLSESGLSFFHPDPLPFRWVVASLDKSDGRWIGFLLDVDWCRFTRQGWYESGGKFIRAITLPVVPELEQTAC
jgi:hypothetical protein